MHVMFIHPAYPSQFTPIAYYLAGRPGWTCSVVCSMDTTQMRLPFTHVNYQIRPGPVPKTFTNPGNFQELVAHMEGLFRGLKSAPQIKPDLVVGHLSYATLHYLRLLYDCPFIGYHEWLPPPFWTDALIRRAEFPPTEESRLFNALHHSFTYLQLHNVNAAYTPTHFQRTTAPVELRDKIRVLFDGIDVRTFQRSTLPRPFTFRGVTLPRDARIVTFVSRGLESFRGFDIFMKAAKIIARTMPNVHFLIAGSTRCNYGSEIRHIGNQTFKDYVLKRDEYDLTNFHFLDTIPYQDLPTLFSLSDLHIYLTVPYVLSWSLLQSMATACTVLGSNTPPLQEVIDHGANGLLAEFLDYEGIAKQSLEVLRDPEAYRGMGNAARSRVLERYANEVCHPKQEAFFREVMEKQGG